MISHTAEHVKELALKGKRIDGREFTTYRNVKIEAGINENADGSARVKFGDTEIYVGIKMEVGVPYPDTPDEGALMVGAELLPLSNPKYEPGPPGIDSIEIARVVDRGVRESKAIDMKKLCITPGEKCWVVNIDIVPLNADGNLFDAAGLATLAALKTTRLPRYEGGVLYPREKTQNKLPLLSQPLPVTVSKIANRFFVDLLEEEEDATEARLTVTTTEDEKTICSLQKGGESTLTIEEISQMIDLAFQKAKELREMMGG